MKGKIWVLLLGVLLIAALIAPTAFASWQSAQLDTRQDMMVRPNPANGAEEMTQEQSQAWQDHFAYMNDFHDQMGYNGMMGMMGGYRTK